MLWLRQVFVSMKQYTLHINYYRINPILRLFLTGSLFLACLQTSGQQNLKKLTPQGYFQWHDLINKALSASGKWVHYNLLYDTGPDSMIVQASSGNKKYILPQHTQGSFIADQWFTARDKNRNLVLLHLESDYKTTFRAIKDFTVSRNGSHFIALQKKAGNTSRLLVQDLEKQDTLYLPEDRKSVV